MKLSQINKPKLIAVEGIDEVNFFDVLLTHLGISDVLIVNFEGKTNFRARIQAIINIPGFRNVRTFALIRDADNLPPQSAFDSIKNSLKSANLPVPGEINKFTDSSPSVGVYIMPGSSEKGMLEDLCLRSIKELSINECIDDFFECANVDIPNMAKAKTLCYLATKTPLVNRLGLGALKGHWDLDSSVFDELKDFLRNLA